jgi:hypothetical protein
MYPNELTDAEFETRQAEKIQATAYACALEAKAEQPEVPANEMSEEVRKAINSVPQAEIALQMLEQGEDGIFECFSVQRRYLSGVLQRAQRMHSGGFYPNERDRQTKILLSFINEASMTFCNTSFPGEKPDTVEKCAERMLAAETGSNAKDRLIDALRDEIHDLNLKLVREKGGRK